MFCSAGSRTISIRGGKFLLGVKRKPSHLQVGFKARGREQGDRCHIFLTFIASRAWSVRALSPDHTLHPQTVNRLDDAET